MAKKTTLQLWTGSGWEDLFPKTRSDMVILSSGDNNLEHRLNTVEAVARGAQQSLAFENYQEAIEYLNNLPFMQLSIGQNIYIRSLNVPDLWVFGTIDIPYNYPYTNDQDFIIHINGKNGGQVGYYILSPLEGSKSVITNDASSQVLVGGVHQSVWNADTKLDKVTSHTGGYYAYAINGTGDQIITRYSSGVIPGALVLRDNNGAISVGEPVSGNNAATKNYVDSNFITKGAPKGTAVKLYGETSEGRVVHRLVNTAATPTQGTIPIYRENGTLAAGTPTETYHATNKGYVDTNFVEKDTRAMGKARVYAINAVGEQVTYDLATADTNTWAGNLAYLRGASITGLTEPTATIAVQTPVNPYAAANKNYVDTNFVGKTEYATATTAGVVKGDKTFGFQVNANGIPTCDVLSTVSEYTNKTVACFISKGTLENAKYDIVKRAITQNSLVLTDDEKFNAKYWLGLNDLYELSKWKLLRQTEVTPNDEGVTGVVLDLGEFISKWYGETWIRIEMPNPNWDDDMPLYCNFGITVEAAMAWNSDPNGCQIFSAQSKSYGMLFKNYANIINLFTNWYDNIPSGTQMQSVAFNATNYPYTAFATANNAGYRVIGKRYLAITTRSASGRPAFPVGTKVLLYGRFPE